MDSHKKTSTPGQIKPRSLFWVVISPPILLVSFGYLFFYGIIENIFFYHIFSIATVLISIYIGRLVSRTFFVVNRLEQISHQLAAIGESIDDALIGRDLDGKIISWNRAAEKIYGYKADEVLGKPFSFLVPSERANEFEELLQSLKKGEKIRHYETVRVRKDGTKMIISLNVSPVIDDQGRIIGAATIAHDITERIILERSRDTFFAIASHELRTPLTAIRGNTALIKELYSGEGSDPEIRGMISDIHESSIRLINIVNDFLDVSSLELGKIKFSKDQVNMAEVIQDNWREYKTLADNKKLTFGLKMDEGLSPVLGDKGRIRQVIANLVLNAINYTREGGIVVELRRKENFAEVLVIDTGIGISRENQGLLFQKFQQAGSNVYARDTTKGTGVGLYLSKLLVEGMGGKVQLISSEIGKGSTFSFTLPLVLDNK